MTNFDLTNEYWVHDSLDQSKVFFFLLWRIFYDPFLCEVKRQKSLCGYCIDSRFVAKIGRLKNQNGLTLFLVAGVFVDDTIWVGSSQAATQYILDIASNFFSINNISINNKKTVVISINRKIGEALLLISGSPISIARKRESHRYLRIYLLSEGLFKPSLAKAHSDVRFFINLVLRKAILDKQFLYLVSAILQPIVNYRSHLKSFEQLQAKCKVASVLSFSNASGLLGRLFVHRSLDLQVLSWSPIHLLCRPIRLHISPVNNFLAGVKRLDSHGPVLRWFNLACEFLVYSFYVGLLVMELKLQDVGGLDNVSCLKQSLVTFNLCIIEVYTDGSLKNFGMQKIGCGAAAYFPDVDQGIGIRVGGLVSSTLAELQAIALALECIPFCSSVIIYLDSQTVLDACATESVLVFSDFQNCCWLEWHGIFNLIKRKGLGVSWHKVKEHLGVVGNEHANKLANSATSSNLVLPVLVKKMFIKIGRMAVSETGPDSAVIGNDMIGDVNWVHIASV
ncbi:hypothetical protein G9A89_019491 [Geosiphon pyriformis]|nr:hypothetical protein G9A89_019491 [Geosiphon pyriformis]